MDVDAVDRLVAAVRQMESDDRPGRSTSVRRRPGVAAALDAAVAAGLDESANALSERALVELLRREAHRAAVAAHYELYPEDRPSRAEVAAVELERRGDPLAEREELLDQAERLLAERSEVEPTAAEVIAAARALDAGAAA